VCGGPAGVVDEGFGACVRGGAMRRPEGLGLDRKVITVEEGKVSEVWAGGGRKLCDLTVLAMGFAKKRVAGPVTAVVEGLATGGAAAES
jgi:hypothetical protein